jgi:diacylglycerol kinase family enzyme
MVSNSRRVGGLEMPIMKNVLFDDGEMEVIMVRKPHNAAETQKLLNVLVTQTPDNDMVHMFTAKDIRFESDSELNWTIDGEYGGAYTDTHIHVEEAAIKMIF